MNGTQYADTERVARRWHRRGDWHRWDEEDAVHEFLLAVAKYGDRFDPSRGEWGAFVARWITARVVEEYVRQAGGRWVTDEHGRRGVRYPDFASYEERTHGRSYEPRRHDPPNVLRSAVWEWARSDEGSEFAWAAHFIADACSRSEMARRSGRSEWSCRKAFDAFRRWARRELRL